MSRPKSSPRFRFTGSALLLSALFFLVPALQNGDRRLYLLAVLIPCAMFLCFTVLARMFSLDRMLLTVSLTVCAAGIASLAVSDPSAALVQSLHCGAGFILLLVGGILIRSLSPSLLTAVCTAFLGLLALAGKLISPDLTLPLAEASLALLLISFASLLSRQGPVSALLVGTTALALLLARGDITEALLWGTTVLFLLFAADGRLVVVLPSLAVVLLLFFGAVRFFPVSVTGPEKVSLSALAASGAVGADVLPEGIGAAEAVSLFPRLVGHYGLIFAGFTVLLFLPLILRGAGTASWARTRFHAILAMGICLLLALRTLTGLLCVFGFLPLSTPAIPLLTCSLPDLCAHLFLIGLLCGISGRNDADLAEDAHLAMLAR